MVVLVDGVYGDDEDGGGDAAAAAGETKRPRAIAFLITNQLRTIALIYATWL